MIRNWVSRQAAPGSSFCRGIVLLFRAEADGLDLVGLDGKGDLTVLHGESSLVIFHQVAVKGLDHRNIGLAVHSEDDLCSQSGGVIVQILLVCKKCLLLYITKIALNTHHFQVI